MSVTVFPYLRKKKEEKYFTCKHSIWLVKLYTLSFLNPDILGSLLFILWLAVYNAFPPPWPLPKNMISISVEIRLGLKMQMPGCWTPQVAWIYPQVPHLSWGWLVLSLSHHPHAAGWAAPRCSHAMSPGTGQQVTMLPISFSFLLKFLPPPCNTEHVGCRSLIHSELQTEHF